MGRWVDRLRGNAPAEQRAAYSGWEALQLGMAGAAFGEASGQLVTPASAEHALATVSACVQGIASAIGSLPAYVHRWEGEARVLAGTHPLQRLIDRGPNATQSWPDWVEWTLASVLLRGNAVVSRVHRCVQKIQPFRPLHRPNRGSVACAARDG